ncbi:hypothetical protein [Blautia massiliensis (ex Liu et al. 2021)]|uniref:hypothetical protein n=1 Tax=Blautia massiliensis (ex Liu et al. 2021) TaxID=3062492 RepID=UPI003F893325
MKKTPAKISQCQNKKIIIATVGLADPADMENVDYMHEMYPNSTDKQIRKILTQCRHG